MTSGSLYIAGSALAFSVMTLLVKMAGARLPSQEIVLARALVSLVLSYALLRRKAVNPWGRAPRLLVVRGLVGFLALSCVYYAVTHLPLAEATVIQYLNPAFTAVLAAVILSERLGLALVTASGISLLGVALVAKPAFLFGGDSSSLDSFAVAVAVCGALFSAGAYVLVRRLAATEHPLVIVFYFPLVNVPASLPFVVGDFVWPEGREWLWLLGVGIATQVGQISLTYGLVALPAAQATSLSYVQVVFAAIFGVLVFGDWPGGLTLIGGALVVAGSIWAARATRNA